MTVPFTISNNGVILRDWFNQIKWGFILGGMDYPSWFVEGIQEGFILVSDDTDFLGTSPLPFLGNDGDIKAIILNGASQLGIQEAEANAGDWIVLDEFDNISIVSPKYFNRYFTVIDRGDT